MPRSEVFNQIQSTAWLDPRSPGYIGWLDLVEARASSMRKCMKEIGQAKLGSVLHWIGKGGHYTKIQDDLPSGQLTDPLGIGLGIRGVFVFDGKTYHRYDSDWNRADMLVYGVLPDGLWVKAHIWITVSGFTVLDKKVELAYTTPDDLCQQHEVVPEQVFKELGLVAKKHAENRMRLADSAQALWYQIKAENDFLGISE